MIWQKKCPLLHHGWEAKKIYDSRTSKMAISVSKEPTLTKFQNNIIINPKEKRRGKNRNFKQENISAHKLYNI